MTVFMWELVPTLAFLYMVKSCLMATKMNNRAVAVWFAVVLLSALGICFMCIGPRQNGQVVSPPSAYWLLPTLAIIPLPTLSMILDLNWQRRHPRWHYAVRYALEFVFLIPIWMCLLGFVCVLAGWVSI